MLQKAKQIIKVNVHQNQTWVLPYSPAQFCNFAKWAFKIKNQKYNEIVEFTSNKNLAIKDISNYNNFCEEREKKMIYTMINFIYQIRVILHY